MQIPVIYDNEIETMSFCSDTPRSRVIFQLEYLDQERADRVFIRKRARLLALPQAAEGAGGESPCGFDY